MSLLKNLAVGAVAAAGVLAVKNRKAIAKEVKAELGHAKHAVKALPAAAKAEVSKVVSGSSTSAVKTAAKTVKRKIKKVSPKKRSAAKRTKTSK